MHYANAIFSFDGCLSMGGKENHFLSLFNVNAQSTHQTFLKFLQIKCKTFNDAQSNTNVSLFKRNAKKININAKNNATNMVFFILKSQ